MKFQKHFLSVDLQLCAEGGTGGDSGEGTGVTGADAVPQKGVKNPLADVKYGIQPEDVQTADAQKEADRKPDRNAEFEKLIKGDYKDLFDKRVQDIVQRRLKPTQEVKAKLEAVNPILETLAGKYGVKSDDVAALAHAIEEDNSFYEAEAVEKGMSVENLKTIRKMEKENAALRQEMQKRNAQDAANRDYARWMEQAEGTKAVYPGFDIQTEMGNDQFRKLLQSGIDVRTAFEVIHKDDILPAAMQYTAAKVGEQITNKVRANAARPSENGSSAQAGVTVKNDVSKFTKADRQEIIRRVARGETIRL